jgi:hypothetical protein
MVPFWFHALAWASVLGGLACGAIIVVDEFRHPQHMWIMNLVWPLTVLFTSVVGLWVYFRFGRPSSKGKTAFPMDVAKGTYHCGAGCCLGDILAEWLAFFVPVVAVWFGWKSLFAEKMFAVWVLDFIFAFIFGIAFQYFTIKPMRKLSAGEGLIEALKADVLSLTAWQVGMYGFMAVAQFWLLRFILGRQAEVNSVEFWFTMQIAMIAGFITSYPVNWWLIRAGIKERM